MDVDKIIDRPALVTLALAIEAVDGVEGVNVTVNEIDIETVGTVITVEGADIDADAVFAAIEKVGAVLHGGARLGVPLAVRVGTAALVTAAFTMFVAYYAEARSHLLRASRQLNLTEPGRLAATNLGREIVRESWAATAVAGLASLVGAAVPLLLGALLPIPAVGTLVLTVGCLGALGWALAASLAASRVRWCLAMLAGGAVVTVIGALLDIA
jgi:hypothetical protein